MATRQCAERMASTSMSMILCRILSVLSNAALVVLLAGCAGRPVREPADGPPEGASKAPSVAVQGDSMAALPSPILQARSRWKAVSWADLPGFQEDALHEAWVAWLKSCERPGPVFAPLCPEVRRLSISESAEQRAWLMSRLQPFQVEALAGGTEGLLTGYFEPVLEASRVPDSDFFVPLYRPPVGLELGKPWYTRQEIDTLPQARAALRGREIAFLADPIDALILQIQGTGRVRIKQQDGSQLLVRLAYAGSNEHTYKSVGRWLLDQGAVRDASWPAIKAWVQRNPARVNDLLWSNPRTIFFKEEPLSDQDAAWGPKGAQGVSLTPGRSIAIDPGSIPYGTPVWLESSGPTVSLQKLVLAQDTGNAIVGGVRADYFAGSGGSAAELAGRLKQPLRLWVLWPKAQ